MSYSITSEQTTLIRNAITIMYLDLILTLTMPLLFICSSTVLAPTVIITAISLQIQIIRITLDGKVDAEIFYVLVRVTILLLTRTEVSLAILEL